MGFKFYNLNPIYRNYISRLSSHTHKNLHPIILIRTLNPHLHDPSLIFCDNPIYNIPKRWHLGHSDRTHDHHHHHHHGSGQEGEKIFRLGLAADIGLAAGKTLTGYLSGSTAIIADAAHSVSDVVLSGVALWSFKVARAPKDKDHPYGHS